MGGQPDSTGNPRPDPAPAALSKATLWPFAISVLMPGILLLVVLLFSPIGRPLLSQLMDLSPQRTVEDRLSEFGHSSRDRWRSRFAPLGAIYAPRSITLVALKQERIVEVYVRLRPQSDTVPAEWAFVSSFPILGSSGVAGPKLREGDLQVPEGIYRVESLNPNSRFHAALRLDYPNEFDREMAARDGRAARLTPLGGDIMIHGGDQSIGCIAIGDHAIEEIFTLAADTGIENVRVVVAPWDLRSRPAPDPGSLDPIAASWSPELYRAIARTLAPLPGPSARELKRQQETPK
ncbi:MAG: hypothetical protein RLY21_662 [Planctomycetota bacterium]